mmetsp:Transcript_15101/g.59121  ORF Transcript_15101/g.59121 Transcript_15101/m.59121 type:complete len:292 (-) Transcript_15101:1260-2135(-)
MAFSSPRRRRCWTESERRPLYILNSANIHRSPDERRALMQRRAGAVAVARVRAGRRTVGGGQHGAVQLLRQQLLVRSLLVCRLGARLEGACLGEVEVGARGALGEAAGKLAVEEDLLEQLVLPRHGLVLLQQLPHLAQPQVVRLAPAERIRSKVALLQQSLERHRRAAAVVGSRCGGALLGLLARLCALLARLGRRRGRAGQVLDRAGTVFVRLLGNVYLSAKDHVQLRLAHMREPPGAHVEEEVHRRLELRQVVARLLDELGRVAVAADVLRVAVQVRWACPDHHDQQNR